MANRSEDWYKQASRDLEQAKASKEAERHEWAFFVPHQAAEKAVKAYHLSLGQEGWGHIIARLLSELPESVGVTDQMVDEARVLDNFYIPTRCPNGHPEGAPFEHYSHLQSEEAIRIASKILEFTGLQMA